MGLLTFRVGGGSLKSKESCEDIKVRRLKKFRMHLLAHGAFIDRSIHSKIVNSFLFLQISEMQRSVRTCRLFSLCFSTSRLSEITRVGDENY